MARPRLYADDAAKQRAYRERQREQLQRTPVPTAPRWARQTWTSQLTAVRDEMQGYYDLRSDEWQEGERGEELAELIDALSQVIDGLST